MKATLVFPPATDPRAPQLALPSLAAVMRPAGIGTTLLDLNLGAVDALLRPDRLARAAAKVKAAETLAVDTPRGRLALMADHLVARAAQALEVLRDGRFYDAAEHNAARDVVTAGLDLVAAASPRGVAYNIAPIKYDVAGVDPSKLSDLVAVTGDRDANLFAEHWEEDVFPELERDRPDLVGITITNRQQVLPGLMLARALKARGFFVVIGGTVYTKFGSKLAERPDFFRHFASGVVVYEGETAIVELCHQLQNKRDFSKVPNYLYLDGDTVKQTPTHVENVDRLPTPDFGGLPLAHYLAPKPVLPILTGKGCYFNRCKFCDIPYINHISSKAYRTRSPEQIVEDVRTLSKRFGSKHFVITDEALSPKLLVKLADAFEPYRHEGYQFTGYARLESGFTREVCQRIAAMGFRKMFFGLESASQRTLDHMDKGTLVSETPEILRNFREAGVDFHVFSIVGFPEEDEASAAETFQFFADNTEVIDAPGNTFDIHPFGLELRTDYWAGRDALGIDVAPRALDRDFVIGLKGSEWKNVRGIDGQRAVQLIYGDFLPRLRRIYRRWHNTTGQLYPGFEEYAVLYGEMWRDRVFPFGTSLPEGGDGRRFRLRLNPGRAVLADGDRRVLVGRDDAVSMDAGTFEAFRAAPPCTIDGLLDATGARTPEAERELRGSIDALLESGFLQLVFEDAAAGRAA